MSQWVSGASLPAAGLHCNSSDGKTDKCPKITQFKVIMFPKNFEMTLLVRELLNALNST